MSEFRREVRFEPGHAIRRTKGDGKNYGAAPTNIRFLLHGEHGTVQFLMSTGWVPEKSPSRFGMEWRHDSGQSGLDLGYHWDAPRYSGHAEFGHYDACEYRANGCYYDGSGLAAEPVLDRLMREGDAGVWAELENYYAELDRGAE